MSARLVLLLILILAWRSRCQPLLEENNDDQEASSKEGVSQRSSLRGGRGGSSYLRRATIMFDPSEASLVPLEFSDGPKRKPKGRHLKENR